MTQESTSNKDNDQLVKDAMDNLSQTQSYQSFVSLFPSLAKGGLTNDQIPSSIPMMFKKGESVPEIEEIEIEETTPVIVREGEKVQEVELEHGQTVFSLDNQDGKLLVDNFMSEDASEYTIDNHLPNSTINSFDPLSSYSPSSYVPSVLQLDDKIIKQDKQEKDEKDYKDENEKTMVNWDGGFTIANKREKPKTNKTTIDSELIMESFDEEDEIVKIQNTETLILSDVLDNTGSTQNSDNAEFIEVEKFSIDEDFDYDNIVLARKYSPETERRLNGRFNEFEEQMSKLNVNKN